MDLITGWRVSESQGRCSVRPLRRGCSAQALDQVWGYDFGGDGNIIEVYVRYLRQKLESAGEPRLIHTVRGVGYILREDS